MSETSEVAQANGWRNKRKPPAWIARCDSERLKSGDDQRNPILSARRILSHLEDHGHVGEWNLGRLVL